MFRLICSIWFCCVIVCPLRASVWILLFFLCVNSVVYCAVTILAFYCLHVDWVFVIVILLLCLFVAFGDCLALCLF